jgi:two-component system sensor histidine kinase/response regulator
MESGHKELDLIEFCLENELAQIIRPLSLRAQRKALKLTICIAPSLPKTLVGNPARLRQIVEHLVDHAIRSAESGAVDIEVGGAPARHSGKVGMKLCVRHVGTGMPGDRQENVPEPSGKGNGWLRQQCAGSGSALRIARELVEMEGGTLGFENRPGCDSAFCAMLDFEAVLAQQCGVAASISLGDRVVLVVEGNATTRMRLVTLLESWDAKSAEAATAQDGLARLQQATCEGMPFDAVLVNSELPDGSGWLLAEHVQRHPDCSEVVVLMLTPDDAVAYADRIAQMKMVIGLDKPVFPSALFNGLTRGLGLARARPPGPEMTSRQRTHRLDLLVAEDNLLNQKLLQRMLEKMGHRVEVAPDGMATLALWQSHPFDAILMDVDMPKMNGYEATEAIRELERGSGRHIPVIAMTAHAWGEAREACLAAGMDGYLSKPINIPELYEEMNKLLQVRTDAVQPAYVDPRTHPELFYEMTRIFLNDYPKYLSALREGIAEGNDIAVRRNAHALKGMCIVFGAQPASQAARQVELAASRARNGGGAAALERELAHLKDQLVERLAALKL